MQLLVRTCTYAEGEKRACRCASDYSWHQVLLVQCFDQAEVKLAERGTSTQHQSRVTIRVPSLSKEPQFSLLINLRVISIVNCPDAFDNLIMVFFYRPLGPVITSIIQILRRDVGDVLDQVLSQAICQAFDVFGLPEFLHVFVSPFDPT